MRIVVDTHIVFNVLLHTDSNIGRLLLGSPISIDDLADILSFNHYPFFSKNYLKPSCIVGFIQRTKPDKPTLPNQKYLIAEKGK